MCSSGTMRSGRPSTSSAVQPNIRSAAGFHSRTVWSAPNAIIASAEEATAARIIASDELTRPIVPPAPRSYAKVSTNPHLRHRFWLGAVCTQS
ncbi:hypothetical protein GCM10023196_092010 [Actinoallomurus vinaceus]|uniref:Uncharacterized protein n=1 Tax=Actinoallomurus vinaceus TaxID=1080074 RepID=A0ABP8USJ3_9ACTN